MEFICLRSPLHEQTQTGLSFRSAWVHFGVWSKPLECLHESRRNETRAGLGSFRSFRPIWKLRSTWNSHVNRNFFRSGRNESCEENCGGDIASFGAIFISVVHFVIHTVIASFLEEDIVSPRNESWLGRMYGRSFSSSLKKSSLDIRKFVFHSSGSILRSIRFLHHSSVRPGFFQLRLLLLKNLFHSCLYLRSAWFFSWMARSASCFTFWCCSSIATIKIKWICNASQTVGTMHFTTNSNNIFCCLSLGAIMKIGPNKLKTCGKMRERKSLSQLPRFHSTHAQFVDCIISDRFEIPCKRNAKKQTSQNFKPIWNSDRSEFAHVKGPWVFRNLYVTIMVLSFKFLLSTRLRRCCFSCLSSSLVTPIECKFYRIW